MRRAQHASRRICFGGRKRRREAGAAENREESSAQCAPAVEEALFRETRVGGVSREKARGRGSRSASRRHPRAWAVRPDLARVAHPFRRMSNPRVARTPRQAARGRWDSRRISAADLSAGFKEVVDARGCDARCTRRARQPCAAPVSVTGLEGKRESGPSSEKCNQPVMIIRRSEPGSGDDRLCFTLFQTVVLGLGSSGRSGCAIIDKC